MHALKLRTKIMYPVLLTLLPALIIGGWILYLDRFEQEPAGLLLRAFGWGCISTIPAFIFERAFVGFFNTETIIGTAGLCFGVIAVAEEGSKYFFLRRFLKTNPHFDTPFDGVVYSVMIGLGFATLENMLYVFGGDSVYNVAIARAFTAVPAHAIFAILMGIHVGLSRFDMRYNAFVGLILAIFFHGAYDFFLMQETYQGLQIIAFLVLIWGARLSWRLIKITRQNV